MTAPRSRRDEANRTTDSLSQLHLTPREAERLRNVSYQRQVEAGMRNPGNAGLTVQRLGDANPWNPEVVGSNGEDSK